MKSSQTAKFNCRSSLFLLWSYQYLHDSRSSPGNFLRLVSLTNEILFVLHCLPSVLEFKQPRSDDKLHLHEVCDLVIEQRTVSKHKEISDKRRRQMRSSHLLSIELFASPQPKADHGHLRVRMNVPVKLKQMPSVWVKVTAFRL